MVHKLFGLTIPCYNSTIYHKRKQMKRTLWSILVLFTLTHAQEYKVLFDLQTDDERTIKAKVADNIAKLRAYYRQQGDTLKVAVVVSGDAYQFFIEDLAHSPYKNDIQLRQSQSQRTKMLQAFAKDATIEICGMGMKHRHIDPKTLYPFVTPAFNRTEALVRFQHEGYAYIPVE